ncbi:Intradiol ring-cleavage dioxygenase [Morchella snyderi]|nr:Intradiol ring-cleavage dioxygenase [Morchella snyderi]
MVQLTNFVYAVAAASIMGAVTAHPGSHDGASAAELARRSNFIASSKRSLAGCASKMKARGFEEKAIARRAALADSIRAKRSIQGGRQYLKTRDLASVLATDHASDLEGVTLNTDYSLLFTGNVSCVLQPEVTQGPYYVDGELVRQDIRETQGGVDLYADVQIVDVATCEPVPNLYLDWWHANATGVYSGIVANGNGDSSDATNIDNSFLRGVQPTDEDGVAQFLTVFPGHYTSRATHVHILGHLNPTVLANNTISGGTVSHVGQVFFDQDLISTVETTSPYSTNTQELTANADDQILSEEAADMDPFMEYVLLGDSIEDGILAWISIGIDTSASYSVSSAATWTEHGGVANSNSGAGGMGGGSAPSGTGAPSGGMTAPTGAPPS